jgi:hypothetical protein
MSDKTTRERALALVDQMNDLYWDKFTEWREQAADLIEAALKKEETSAEISAIKGPLTVNGEDWENACHEIIWKQDPELFEKIRRLAYLEAERRVIE